MRALLVPLLLLSLLFVPAGAAEPEPASDCSFLVVHSLLPTPQYTIDWECLPVGPEPATHCVPFVPQPDPPFIEFRPECILQ